MAVLRMPMDGRYVARSQGWRCDECPGMDGMQQGATDGGVGLLIGARHAAEDDKMATRHIPLTY
ncbi:MAG: hypothetical protein JKY88_03855 [Pseudomonadales bacterium]|nr:hypothetical protein [Pseudomonadales bacterium]